jgi:hypothetical protein
MPKERKARKVWVYIPQAAHVPFGHICATQMRKWCHFLTSTTHVANVNINHHLPHHCRHHSPLPLRPSTNTTPSTPMSPTSDCTAKRRKRPNYDRCSLGLKYSFFNVPLGSNYVLTTKRPHGHPLCTHPPLLRAPARRVIMGPILDNTTTEPTHHPHLCCEQLLAGWMGVVTNDQQRAHDGRQHLRHQQWMPMPTPDDDTNA